MALSLRLVVLDNIFCGICSRSPVGNGELYLNNAWINPGDIDCDWALVNYWSYCCYSDFVEDLPCFLLKLHTGDCHQWCSLCVRFGL